MHYDALQQPDYTTFLYLHLEKISLGRIRAVRETGFILQQPQEGPIGSRGCKFRLGSYSKTGCFRGGQEETFDTPGKAIKTF